MDRRQALAVADGIDHAAAQPVEHGLVLALGEQALGQAPDLRKAAVEGADAAGQVGHQDAVASGFQRGLQFGHQQVTLFQLALLAAAVQQGHQEGRGLGFGVGVGAEVVSAGKVQAQRVRAKLADAPLHMQQAALGIDQHRFGQQRRGAAGAHLVPVGLVFGCGDQRVSRLAQQVGLAAAQQRQSLGVDGDHRAAARAHQPGRLAPGPQQAVPGGQGWGGRGRHAHAACWGWPCRAVGSGATTGLTGTMGVTGSKKYTMRGRGDR